MRKFLTVIFCAMLAVVAEAQITAPVVEEKPETDMKYMEGAVPEVNGEVILTRTIDLPEGLSQQEAVSRADAWLTRITKDERMLYNQRLPQDQSNVLMHSYSMELTFSKSFISHDFTQMSFVLVVTVEGRKARLDMRHIVYKYRENDKDNRYMAEEMITDKYALNKKHTKLVFGYKKFRMKTIDLMDELAVSLRSVY